MEILFSVENFEENNGKYREINSPRTLESCLRNGLDPAELYPKPKSKFTSSILTDEMIDIKYETFERKRKDKIISVKLERQQLIQYNEKKRIRALALAQMTAGASSSPEKSLKELELEAGNAALEQEERRIEALRRRQEKELNKIVERESTMAMLQQKIKHAEEEEIKKKKLHEKKVIEERLVAEKKQKQRVLELKRLEEEESEKKREIARRDAAIADKLQKKRLQQEREIMKEARLRDEERKLKVEEARRKTELLLKAQEDLAEVNRIKMMEREYRILQQLEQKKEQKKEEILLQRELADKRIAEALEKYHELHTAKKQEFDRRQKEATVRARENELKEKERLKKQADDRDKRNKSRLNRLIDAFKGRADHRQSIVDRRNEKNQVYEIVRTEREKQIALLKFTTDLKLKDKLENVERVARMNEFKRLQTLQKISTSELKYEEIQAKREELLRKNAEESKNSLIRKHEISDAMDRMRMTNDFTLLDKLFAKKKKDKKDLGKTDDAEEKDDPRLAQTI